MQDISNTLDVLTAMIAVNSKRVKLYQSLAEKVNNDELRPLFNHYADQSRRFISTLSTWRAAYGGFAISDKGAGRSPWSQIKSLFDGGLQKNMMLQCEELESEVIRIYKTALNTAFIPAAPASDVQQQCREFEKALGKVRLLRERPAAAREVFART